MFLKLLILLERRCHGISNLSQRQLKYQFGKNLRRRLSMNYIKILASVGTINYISHCYPLCVVLDACNNFPCRSHLPIYQALLPLPTLAQHFANFLRVQGGALIFLEFSLAQVNAMLLKTFMHEVLHQSQTSCCMLQTHIVTLRPFVQ